ncbi:hypothetical protein RhiirC2_798320 [Rhizophagus irregularis]|uniref:CCHC-type domain-containing protein n=1 Tax=Rhizophagus irregularis TaxID=588596 RepID=A0A2N1M6M2_9GLOM|nr:hypothetical protein RhiirC2_798320 [Rhizophagus irregularis]
MSGSMNRNPSSQPTDNNKDRGKDSFSTFTPQDESDFTEVLSKRNERKKKQQQQHQTTRQHAMTTRSFSTGLQTTRRPSIPNDFPNELSNDLQDESSMDLDNNNKNDNQQSTRQSFNDKQASNLPPEDLDDQQNGKFQLYKDYDIVKITTIYQKKDKENLFQIEFDNQDQYDKFINAEFKFIENDEPIKFQIKDNIVSKYGKIENLYTRVKEQHTVRVIPLLLNNESREDRYGYALKLTGLPFGITGRELTELLKESGAKSVVIPRNPKNYNLLKYAMVYFSDEDVLTETASLELNIKGSVLFWLNLDEKTCHACNSPEHIAKDCDKERQIKPKYLNRTQALNVTKGGNNNRRRQQSYSNNNRKEWNEKNIIHDNPYMGNNGHPIQKDNKALREEFTLATTLLNNNNKRVHIEDSGSSSDLGMDEFEAKLSKSDEKIEQNMTLLTQIAKKLKFLSSKITSSSNMAGLEDEDNAIVED